MLCFAMVNEPRPKALATGSAQTLFTWVRARPWLHDARIITGTACTEAMLRACYFACFTVSTPEGWTFVLK